jgi:phosphorylase kinase alpha/beta subunit
MAMTAPQRQERLEYYYHQIKSIILKRQNPISGLLPASTALTTVTIRMLGYATMFIAF